MTLLPKIDMAEVTRLIREGRLQDAMAMLRGATLHAPGESSTPSGDRQEAPASLMHPRCAQSPGKGPANH